MTISPPSTKKLTRREKRANSLDVIEFALPGYGLRLVDADIRSVRARLSIEALSGAVELGSRGYSTVLRPGVTAFFGLSFSERSDRFSIYGPATLQAKCLSGYFFVSIGAQEIWHMSDAEIVALPGDLAMLHGLMLIGNDPMLMRLDERHRRWRLAAQVRQLAE